MSGDDDVTRPREMPAGQRQTLLDKLRVALSGTPGVRLIYAFGSFVREEPFRDLDLAIVLMDPDDWRAIGRVDARVSEALGRLPFKVEVVPINDAPASFRREVIRDGVRLWEVAPSAGLDFEVQTVSEHMDFEAFRRAHEAGA